MIAPSFYLCYIWLLMILIADLGSSLELSRRAQSIHNKLFPTPLKVHQMLYGFDPHNDTNNVHPIYSSNRPYPSTHQTQNNNIDNNNDNNSNNNNNNNKNNSNRVIKRRNLGFSDSSQRGVFDNHPHRSLVEQDVCPKCSNLTVCRSLNNKMVQEKYDPNHINTKITCSVLEDLGSRLSEEIFGNGKSFRDTPQCRDIVMQYLCMFWGSENLMYSNSCLFKEDTSNAIAELQRFAPRPPCRSFCVQISLVCANSKEFGQLCANIACPPEEEECTPDPTVDEQKLNMGLGCELPYDLNPYVRIRGSASQLMNANNYYLVTMLLAVLSSVLLII